MPAKSSKPSLVSSVQVNFLMELVERRLIPPLGHFSLVRFRKIEIAAAA